MRLNIDISKSAVLLANENQSDQKKCEKMLFVKFSLCICSRKNDAVS